MVWQNMNTTKDNQLDDYRLACAVIIGVGKCKCHKSREKTQAWKYSFKRCLVHAMLPTQIKNRTIFGGF